jgi:hypothetical protein
MSWLNRYLHKHASQNRRRKGSARFRPFLQLLEDRTLPSTFGLAQLNSAANAAHPSIKQLGGAGSVAAQPLITDHAGPGVVAGIGAKLTDSATLTGGLDPTGAIVFTLYGPDNKLVDTETVAPISGDGTYTTPTGYAPTKPGLYQWNVAYTGDALNATISDVNDRNAQVTVSPQPFTISGTAFKDTTGNGFSSDDAPMKGAVIELFNTLAKIGTKQGALASTTTDDHGGYTFTVSAPGTYYVQEVVPSGLIQTGGGGDTSQQGNYYTVKGQPGNSYGGINFATYQVPTGQPTKVVYTVTAPGGKPTTVTDLRGHTQPGDTVTLTFTIPAGTPASQLTLVTYTATGSSFTESNASSQRIFDEATGVFAAGKTYSLTVQIPTGYYQIDFVRGAAISEFIPPDGGPDKDNITYHGQQRFISGDNGGAQLVAMPHVQKNDFGTVGFWNNSAKGQKLISQLNGSAGATALGNWLAANFAHLFGALADPTNAQEKNLAGLTNAQLASFFRGLYSTNQTYAQIMATALSAYATDPGLAGGSYAKAFGFHMSVNGTGLDSFSVGTAGSILGFANNSTQTVLTILHSVDQLASSTAILKSDLLSLNALFAGINTVGGIS